MYINAKAFWNQPLLVRNEDQGHRTHRPSHHQYCSDRYTDVYKQKTVRQKTIADPASVVQTVVAATESTRCSAEKNISKRTELGILLCFINIYVILHYFQKILHTFQMFLRHTVTATYLLIYQNDVQDVKKLLRKSRYKNVIFVA